MKFFVRLSLSATFVLLSACGERHSQDVKAQTILHRGLGGEPGTLDPASAGDTFSLQILDDLYEGLTSEAADGTVQPAVANSWTVSSDGLTYTFKLREDARWSNGEKVTAGQFVNAWRRVLNPKTASPGADNLRIIAGARDILAGRATPASLQVSAPHDDELIVKLDSPAVYFPELLTHASAFPIYSEAAAASHSTVGWVSNGAFVLLSWTPGASIRLKRNDGYWDKPHVSLDQVEYVPAPDENTEYARYRSGALDLTESVPPTALSQIKRDTPMELKLTPFLATAYYAFNLHQGAFKDNPSLRQALDMVVDREALLSTVLPFGLHPAYGFVAEGVANYSPQAFEWKGKGNDERISIAKALYAKSGYTISKPLKIRLLYNSNPVIKQIAVLLSAMWRESLGVETTLVEEEYRVFLQSRKDAGRYELVRLGWSADYNDAGSFLDTFRSDSVNNDSGYANREYDELLNRAATESDAARRRGVLEQAERLMLKDYPILPLYYFATKRLVKPYVDGRIDNPLNRLYSKDFIIRQHTQ